MCGIFGYFDRDGRPLDDDALARMGREIVHRGPDGDGIYHDRSSAIGLGNQRLAILDVEHGQQPFYSDDGDIVVVQNGEIFNHVELAEELRQEGTTFTTHCDTEVILRLYERHGIDAVSRLNGMFAIAILDRRDKALYLIRDRIGEKPLHVMLQGRRVYFGSEIKSILEVCGTTSLDYAALNQFFTFNYVPPPRTMFEDIVHVMPGHYLKISDQGVEDTRWWDLAGQAQEERSEAAWIDEFQSLLHDAVRIRLRSDVPFGAFLSGGVDSSSVVGSMSQQLDYPVKTFTIGFHDPRYDESPFAAEAAERFGTEHVMRKVEPNMLDDWPLSLYHCDQPHGDVSFLPTLKVAGLAAEQVKMVLTGDGADELFAGYDKYKSFFGQAVDGMSDEQFRDNYLDNISLFTQPSRDQLFTSTVKNKLTSLSCTSFLGKWLEQAAHMDRINQALYIDMMLLLPGNNLVKPDRMGMAVSLENRAPFMDYRMMEFAFRMPGNLKLMNGETKYIYKKAVSPLIGEGLAYRKKQMFTVPVGEWFKKELYPLCQDLLLSSRAVSRGLFEPAFVSHMLESHKNGEENFTREIRSLMAMETWFRIVEERWGIEC